MKIGVTTFGGDGGKSGISQYIIAMLQEFDRLQRQFSNLSFEVIVHEDERDVFMPANSVMGVLTQPASLRPAMKNLIWHQTELPRICRERGYDVLFLTAGNRRLPFISPCPTVGAVFDFSILHIPGKYDTMHHLYITRILPMLARRLTSVITLSESSKKDIVEFAGVPANKVQVIPAAADTSFYRPIPVDEAREYLSTRYPQLSLDRPYLIYVSRIEHPGKNHVRLIQAFAQMKKEHNLPHQLVLAGSDWNGAEAVHAEAAASPVSKDILFTGFAPRKDLPYLYAGCELFVCPSLWEGFGLPVLEAMSTGVPVASANVSSLPEVTGDAAVLFDPLNVSEMAQKLSAILLDSDMRRRVAQEGYERSRLFSWERAARETLTILQNAAMASRSVALPVEVTR